MRHGGAMFDGLKRMLRIGRRENPHAGLDQAWRENMERSDEGLLIIRPPGRIVHANGAAGVLLGRESGELTDTMFPHPVTPGGLTSIVVTHGKDGPSTLEAGAVAISWQGAPAWLVTLRDVTGSRRVSSMKIERVKVLEKMAQGVPLADILIALVQFVESRYPLSIGTVMLLDPDGIRLRYGASTQLPHPLIEAADKIMVGAGQGACGAAAFERKAVFVKDIANSTFWPEGAEVALENGIRACWSIPIFSTAGEVIGTFATYYRTPREPTTDEIDLVSACAQVSAVAIERHRVEAQLRLLESSIAHLNDMVVITDVSPIDEPGPRMVFVNDALLKHSGYRREQLLGKSPRIFQGPLTQRDELDRVREALAARQPVRAEVINYAADGSHYWLEMDITSITDARGRVTHFVSVQRDITGYKQIQAAMQQSEERFRLVARLTTDVIWDWNLVTGKIWWSEGIKTLFGHEVAENGTDLDTWTKWLHDDDRDRIVDGINAVIDGDDQEWVDEYRLMRSDGSYAHVIDRGFVTRDSWGKPVRMVGGIKDVSERHEAEARARRTAQTQALIVRAQRQIAEDDMDLGGIMQLIAQRAQELTGASGAAVINVEGDALVYRAVSGSTHNYLGLNFSREQSLATLAMQTGEPQICHDSETDARVDPEACRVVGARSLMCVALSRHDIDSATLSVISGRRRAFDARDLANLEILADSLGSALQRERDADQLQKSEAKYRSLFESNPQPMLVYDADTWALLAVNTAAVEQYGYSRESFLKLGFADLHPATELPGLQQQREATPGQRPCVACWRHHTSAGQEIDVEVSSDDIQFEDKPAVLALVVDITSRLEGERQLLRISRARLMLSRCNEAMIRAETEQQLFEAMCRIGVETGGYRLGWVGLAMDDEARSIDPVACFGEGTDYLKGLRLSWSAQSETGLGPSGRTVREGIPVLVADMSTDPAFANWSQRAQEYGFRAAICLPLHQNERTFGHLSFYSAEVLPIGDEELELLRELADNLAYGVEHLRAGIDRENLQAAVLRLAEAASATNDEHFFAQLTRAMAQAVAADAAFIVRLPRADGRLARVVAATVDGQPSDLAEISLEGAPFAAMDSEDSWVMADHLEQCLPQAGLPGVPEARACAGRRLDGANGQPLGLLLLLFRKPLRRPEYVKSTMVMFAIRAAAELEQRAASARIRDQAALLNKTRDAIVACDMDQRITFWNKAAESLYGWTAEEMLGVSHIEQVLPDPGLLKHMLDTLKREGEWSGQLEQRRKDGSRIMVQAQGSLVRDDDGTPRCFYVMALADAPKST